ncbi:hypothetical protein [Symmachiella dynata]|uniref:hypothetical protein n=1 Tax=Symmachiella dynata TaxID=2527995 RepID=UPI0030EDFFCD
MPEYDNTNRGVLFRNKNRKTDKHPDYTGTINIRGEEFRLAAWTKTSRNSGQKFFSLSVDAGEKLPIGQHNQEPRLKAPPGPIDIPEDGIPF